MAEPLLSVEDLHVSFATEEGAVTVLNTCLSGGAIEITDCVPRFMQNARVFHPMAHVRSGSPW